MKVNAKSTFNIEIDHGIDVPVDISVFENLFPFAFAFDTSLTLVLSNPSIRKMMPELLPGRSLGEFFTIAKPRILLNFDAICEKLHSLQTWCLNDGTELQGQLFHNKDKNLLFFVGTPIVKDTSEIKALGLVATDFALHDSTLQHLFMQQAQKTAIADSAEMVEALRRNVAEKERLEQIQSELALELDIGFDIKVRFQDDGTIIDIQVSSSLEMTLDASQKIGKSLFKELDFLSDSLQQAVDDLEQNGQSLMFNFKIGRGRNTRYFESRLARATENNCLMLANDVSERYRMQLQLERRANFDYLTNLPNRAHFNERLNKLSVSAIPNNHLYTIINVDLDNFKHINSRYGNAAGDQVLQRVSEILLNSTRIEDIPARLGGDEFVVFFAGEHDRDEMIRAAQRISEKIRKPIAYKGQEIKCNCSIGIAFSCEAKPDLEVLQRQANLAMEFAKDDGKGKVIEYVEGMYEKSRERLELREQLVKAIDNKKLSIAYQPIVWTNSGKIKGFEALARWIDEDKGFVPPDVFIDIAEESGLMIPLGRSIMDIALKNFALFIGQKESRQSLTLAINVSVHQLYDAGFVHDLNSCLKAYELNARQVILEITETAFIRDITIAIEMLNELKSHGFKLALDDFGTGFSSLGYLEHLPLDILKIDRSFINKIEDENSDAPLVKAILSIANELNFETVAEGIETDKQRLFLQASDCMYSQGYYFSKPLSVEHLNDLDL